MCGAIIGNDATLCKRCSCKVLAYRKRERIGTYAEALAEMIAHGQHDRAAVRG
jgi:hypothetical protein